MKSKRRILLTSINFYPYASGGGQKYVLMLAKAMQRRGDDVAVVSLVQNRWNGGTERREEIHQYDFEGIPVHAIHINPTAITQGQKYAVNHPLLRECIRRVVNQCSPDIIHVNGLDSVTFTVAAELRIPIVATIHHSGVACPAGTLMYHDGSECSYAMHHTVCIPCCSYQRVPRSTLAGFIIGKIPRWFYQWYGWKVDPIKKLPFIFRVMHYPWLVQREMDHLRQALDSPVPLIAPSHAIRRLLIRNGVSENRIHVIPHGIDPLERMPLPTLTHRPVKFGFIGSVDYVKGVHLLVSALGRLQNQNRCEFHLYGDVNKNHYFDAIMKSYRGSVPVTCHGFFPINRLNDAYANIDVLVVPSLAYEAFGFVVQEALSAGRPVIVSRSGALPELVIHHKYGIIVERNNVASLTEALQSCINHPDRVEEMAANVPSVKTIDTYADEIAQEYLSVLRESSTGAL